MDETEGDTEAGDNSIPAGMAFFGQFIDHDITLDTTPLTGQQNDPAAERNFRTPHLDLDSVYGTGPENEPHIYQQDDLAKFRIGTTDNPDDLPRDPATGIAFIPDERNDENLFISQLHLLFLKFHNNVVDYLREESDGPVGDEFEKARRIVQWHYQWIILNEFLPLICDRSIVDDVMDKGRKFFKYNKRSDIYMPVEFSGAAYRFGHSLIRRDYRVNNDKGSVKIFDPDINKGFEPVPTDSVIDWGNFFNTTTNASPQMSRRIDNKLATPLFQLPFEEDHKSLAVRNLLRGKQLGLPSGQSAAKFMGPRLSRGRSKVPVLTSDEIGLSDPITASNLPADTPAPLWYYILSEAKIQNNGEHLGKVGSRIVAEALLGFIESDNTSYLTANPNWTPGNPGTEQPSPLPRSVSTGDDFTMGDLAVFATSD